jgi:hypothetical protein
MAIAHGSAVANRRVVHLQTLLSLLFCPLASFAEVGFVCGKLQKWLRNPTKTPASR